YVRWGLDPSRRYMHGLAAFDLQTGQTRWMIGDAAPWDELRPVSDPVVAGDRLYLLAISPGLLATSDEESVLVSPPPALAEILENARVYRVFVPRENFPESSWLGLRMPREMWQQGPLTVAAFGADPPAGSTEFHLSLLSVGEDGELKYPTTGISAGEYDQVVVQMARLAAKNLTPVAGEGFDHGLVWEKGSLDLKCADPEEAVGNRPHDVLPEGDGESMLRRLIDDSINLLSELEFNRVRQEEGLPPLNCLWPWAPGRRQDCPNLALHRGELATVVSNSLRQRGLVRLCGYQNVERYRYETRERLDSSGLLNLTRSRSPSVVLISRFFNQRAEGDPEEVARAWNEFGEQFLAPYSRPATDEEVVRLTLVALDRTLESGLALVWSNQDKPEGTLPFDERVLDDRRLTKRPLYEIARDSLALEAWGSGGDRERTS
ncbi:MAG: hypothetical protein ACOCX1_06130, partial [Fimbriimonadaceae bacterium]